MLLHRLRSAQAYAAPGCAVLGVLALLAAMGSLLPGEDIPAWPAGTVAIAAVAFAWFPGRVLLKAVGTLSSAFALVLTSLEITALWTVSAVLP